MPDDKIAPRIMASTTVRPTIVAAQSVPPTAHAHELTPGVSTVEQVQSAIVGAKAKAATKQLEALGFEVRVVSLDGKPHEEPHSSNGECANLTVVGGKVTHVALG